MKRTLSRLASSAAMVAAAAALSGCWLHGSNDEKGVREFTSFSELAPGTTVIRGESMALTGVEPFAMAVEALDEEDPEAPAIEETDVFLTLARDPEDPEAPMLVRAVVESGDTRLEFEEEDFDPEPSTVSFGGDPAYGLIAAGQPDAGDFLVISLGDQGGGEVMAMVDDEAEPEMA